MPFAFARECRRARPALGRSDSGAACRFGVLAESDLEAARHGPGGNADRRGSPPPRSGQGDSVQRNPYLASPQSIAPWARSPPALVAPGWLVDLPRRPVLEVRPNARDDDRPGLLVEAVVESQEARGARVTALAQVSLRGDFAPPPGVVVLGH